jgi:hypothetical protein
MRSSQVPALHVVQVPILLGRGVRLWDGVESVEKRYDIEAVSSPSGVTHLHLHTSTTDPAAVRRGRSQTGVPPANIGGRRQQRGASIPMASDR